MSTALAIDALAVVASGVFLVRLLPQPIALARTGVPDGVSPMAALNATISALAWIAYGLAAHLPVVWGVSVLALVPGVWQSALLWRQVRRRDLLGAGGFVAVLVLAAVAGVFGLALGASVLFTCGPQVVEAVRSADLSGVAAATWIVALLDAVTWGAYGLAIGDQALVGYFAVLLTSAVIVLVRLRTTRRGVGALEAVVQA